MGFSKRTVLIGQTGSDTRSSIPDPTLSLSDLHVQHTLSSEVASLGGHPSLVAESPSAVAALALLAPRRVADVTIESAIAG